MENPALCKALCGDVDDDGSDDDDAGSLEDNDVPILWENYKKELKNYPKFY